MLLSLGHSLLLLSTNHKMDIFILKNSKKYYFYLIFLNDGMQQYCCKKSFLLFPINRNPKLQKNLAGG
jgi:hypothetical protein